MTPLNAICIVVLVICARIWVWGAGRLREMREEVAEVRKQRSHYP